MPLDSICNSCWNQNKNRKHSKPHPSSHDPWPSPTYRPENLRYISPKTNLIRQKLVKYIIVCKFDCFFCPKHQKTKPIEKYKANRNVKTREIKHFVWQIKMLTQWVARHLKNSWKWIKIFCLVNQMLRMANQNAHTMGSLTPKKLLLRLVGRKRTMFVRLIKIFCQADQHIFCGISKCLDNG